jgi:hypothetical protein
MSWLGWLVLLFRVLVYSMRYISGLKFSCSRVGITCASKLSVADEFLPRHQPLTTDWGGDVVTRGKFFKKWIAIFLILS